MGVVAEAPGLADAMLHGKPLGSHAWRALRDAGIEVVTPEEPWMSVQARGLPLVVHDAACPLTPAKFIAAQVERATVSDRVQVGCRPVTDTLKTVTAGRVGATVDRDSLVEVAAPIVLPASFVAVLAAWPDLSDLPALVNRLRRQTLVDLVEAPSLGRRVPDESAVLLLEAFEELAGQ